VKGGRTVIPGSQVTRSGENAEGFLVKNWFLAVVIAAVASIIVTAAASAKVERYQPAPTTATFTVTNPAGVVGQWENVWTHDYTVTVNPDNGTFTGTGKVYGHDQNGEFSGDETITGKFGNGTVSFTTTYEYDGVLYSLSLVNAPFGGDVVSYATVNPGLSWPVEMKVTNPVFTGDTYKNHGDYVSSLAGGTDVAHSPIGKPIQSNSGE
jgi:hypothetical protein